MGVVLMSKRELNRLEVLARLDSDRLTIPAAADLMKVTLRQTYRLLSRYRAGGAPAIANRRRGRPSNNRLPDTVRDHAIALVQELTQILDRHWRPRSWRNAMIFGSRERRFATGCGRPGSGCLAPSANGSSSQDRREHVGELIQIDGSEHRWFEDRAAPCTLLVFVDDATSQLMELRFVASESTFAYFEALKAYLRHHGSRSPSTPTSIPSFGYRTRTRQR